MNLCLQDTPVGTSAFNYLCTNLQSVYSDYNPDKFRDTAFVRAENTGGPRLETLGKVLKSSCPSKFIPSNLSLQVFLDSQWKTLGFSVIQDKNRERVLEEMGVQRHPPSSLLLERLEKEPPSNEEIARQWFEILSNHVSSKQSPFPWSCRDLDVV